MATIDEIFEAMPEESTITPVNDALIIDPNARAITIPSSELIFGVEHDNAAERKYFLCPRVVGNNVDLTAAVVRVNYKNANGETDAYIVTDLTADGDIVVFSWEISEKAVRYKGTIQFLVCVSIDGRPEWHTTLASGQVLEGLEPDTTGVEEATSDVIAQLVSMVEAQTTAVQNEGAAQIQAVKTASEEATATATAEIESKGANTLASIPEDYTALSATVDGLVRSTAHGIVCEAEGSVVSVSDASDNYIQGLRIFGHSTQDGTPTPEAPVEIVSVENPVVAVCGKNLLKNEAVTQTLNGVTFTVNYKDGSFTVKGTASAATFFGVDYNVKDIIPGEVYCLTGCPAGGSGSTYQLYAQTSDGRVFAYDAGSGTQFTGTDAQWQVLFVVYKDTVVDLTVYPLLRLASVADTAFEPYKAPQTVELTHTLPGIPVTSGGNYTDENGQQWICDEVDLERGVYVQRVRNLVFSGEEEIDNTWYPVAIYHIHSPAPHVNLTHDSVRSSHFSGVTCGNTLGTSIAFGNLDKLGFASSGDLTAFFAEQYAQNNPVTVQYAIATPIETPLSEAEIAAYRALHTNKPYTTILNDSGAHMAVAYTADTKLYIDNKIAALTA